MNPAVLIALARSWWKAVPGFIVGCVLAFPLGQCSGSQAQKKHEQADRAVAITEAVKLDANAKEKSAEERTRDAIAVTDMKDSLTDAIASLPDSVPSARRVALGCQRMLNAGTRVSELPVACGPGIAAKADPAR